jgi:hypothetical protein
VKRAYYSAPVTEFLSTSTDTILGRIARQNEFDLTPAQRDAWLEQITALKNAFTSCEGSIYLEFSIPRMGRRIDAVAIVGPLVLVIEFKVGKRTFDLEDLDQVVDYALDLHNFHEGSHTAYIAPILVCTEAPPTHHHIAPVSATPSILPVSKTNAASLPAAISTLLRSVRGETVQIKAWEDSGYKPTPTIIEATLALYRGHSVVEIARSDAGAANLNRTSKTVAEIIADTRRRSEKAICFVTGVPGAGKTLVGLDAATKHIDRRDELYSVFLSGNGPLVAILQEALARDRVQRSRQESRPLRKGEALSEVKAFIQNVHHFRDDCLKSNRPPVEHVAIFDEAQRAWTQKQTIDFMRRKKGVSDFTQSEPEFLISCLERHSDWAVVVCLVGGGQEINTGEAGIREWLESLRRSFPHWRTYISDRLTDTEYAAGAPLEQLRGQPHVQFRPELHLATSMRSFRSEHVSRLVKEVLDLDSSSASQTLRLLHGRYPIVLTRDFSIAREWVRRNARGSERYGIVISSAAERLKPYALDVKTPVDPVKWFLNDKTDVRSSFYLEDVATEFHVQGLELDWTCVAWDADFRYTADGWEHWSFRGSTWQKVRARDRQTYLKNAYRVLLTRARQGMVIVVPDGDASDPTRSPTFYDSTFGYLRGIGLPVLSSSPGSGLRLAT